MIAWMSCLHSRERHLLRGRLNYSVRTWVFKSLYESKVHQHPNVYAFPSSVDGASKARNITQDPADQATFPIRALGSMES